MGEETQSTIKLLTLQGHFNVSFELMNVSCRAFIDNNYVNIIGLKDRYFNLEIPQSIPRVFFN
jgi:hypothetical protein